MTHQWQIVDQHGDVVVTADTVAAVARAQRRTPRAVAQRDARLMVNTDAGDAPVFAVPVPNKGDGRCLPMRSRRMILHALGLSQTRRWSYRNYVAGCDDTCEPMVPEGLMVRGRVINQATSPMQIYHVTDTGARAAGVFNRFRREDRLSYIASESDRFDDAVDDATHCVIEAFDTAGFILPFDEALGDLMVRINDALTAIMNEAAL